MPDDPPRTNGAPLGQSDTAVPTWARRTIYTGAGAFGALNLTLSSLSIGHLSYEHLHLGILRSIALGLTPDAGALVAGTLWVACTGHLRTWGRNASLGLVAGSVVGNAADILATAGHVTPLLVPLAVLMATAAPILALIMGHLVLLVQAAGSPVANRPAVAPDPGPVEQADAVPAEATDEPTPQLVAPEQAESDLAPASLHLASRPASNGKPWTPRAQEFIRAGMKDSSAYTKARREWMKANPGRSA